MTQQQDKSLSDQIIEMLFSKIQGNDLFSSQLVESLKELSIDGSLKKDKKVQEIISSKSGSEAKNETD